MYFFGNYDSEMAKQSKRNAATAMASVDKTIWVSWVSPSY